jgi:diaminopimelate epimerase
MFLMAITGRPLIKMKKKVISFKKYQATGNDFIMIDNRKGIFPHEIALIQKLCDRRFGIGADGLILIQSHPTLDFEMVYFNSDGSQSLCGNGSRCAVAFAKSLGLIQHRTEFEAYDGPHEAIISGKIVRLKMNDVSESRQLKEGAFLNTGSPHLVRFVSNVAACQVAKEGAAIRNNATFKQEGVNVNFVEVLDKQTLFVRTYERGVEDETYSCGTGVTAAALAATSHGCQSPVNIQTKGGNLSVEFEYAEGRYSNVFLIGPALKVFSGKFSLAAA